MRKPKRMPRGAEVAEGRGGIGSVKAAEALA